MRARLFASAVFALAACALGPVSCSLDTVGDPVRGGSDGQGGAGAGGGFGGTSGTGASGAGPGSGGAGTSGSGGAAGTSGAAGAAGSSGGDAGGSGGTSGGGGASGSGVTDASGAGGASGSASEAGGYEIEAGIPTACDSCMKTKCPKRYDACAKNPTCDAMVACFVACVDAGRLGCAYACGSYSMKADKEGLALLGCSKAECPVTCRGF